ncbi:MAG: ATP-dependent DNA helicase, partial [Candidatus Saccharimonas sp.]
ELKFNLQEKYQYIMVDEFQDTNLAQLRVLFGLTDNPVNEGRPNIMAVGDDDQAIYSFQGADVNNIHRFISQYRDVSLVTLIDNYRSSARILESARDVISQGSDRLESTIESIDKTLTAHHAPDNSAVKLYEIPTSIQERQWLAQSIRRAIDGGETPASIAVLAKRHQELVALLPYLYAEGINVNYERRDNVLDFEPIKAIERIARIVDAYSLGNFDTADSLLPELLAHPAFSYANDAVWRLSLQAWQHHQTWSETMLASPEFAPLIQWLIDLSQQARTQPLEILLDHIIGKQEVGESDVNETTYRSPLYDYYFSEEKLRDEPDAYLTYLEALRTLRSKLREFRSSEDTPLLHDLLTFIDLHRQLNTPITTLRQRAETEQGAINLMSAHKAKGLEYDHVYIIGAVDSAWGQRVHSPSRLISYPENLPIAPAGSTYDERLRLFFVAMTRAKRLLTISYSLQSDNAKTTLPASFLLGTKLTPIEVHAPQSIHDIASQLELDWQQQLLAPPTTGLRELLQPQLDRYKLSATHLNNFLDVSRGGPLTFLANNLLRFPQAKSANAAYGTAIHSVLQQAHNHIAATGKSRPIEDLLGIFEKELQKQHLSQDDFTFFSKRGLDALGTFLNKHYTTFEKTQKTELNFANQNVFVGKAHLTGSLDLVDFSEKSVTVTDYKTGSPSREWKGKSDYEKIKLHKYRQQLMFYELLVKYSRDYAKYDFNGAVLQFVEPDKQGNIHSLSTTFSETELNEFKVLLSVVWNCIITLDLPDISLYEPTYKGMIQFEQDLIRQAHDGE